MSLEFSSGGAGFSATVAFVALPCCTGYFAEPPSAAVVDVPANDAGPDA